MPWPVSRLEAQLAASESNRTDTQSKLEQAEANSGRIDAMTVLLTTQLTAAETKLKEEEARATEAEEKVSRLEDCSDPGEVSGL